MRVTKWPAILLCGTALALALPLPAAAQNDAVPEEPLPPPIEEKAATTEAAPAKKVAEDPPLHRWGGWTVSVAAWQPSLVGAEEEIAATFQSGFIVPLMAGSSTHIRETVEVTYHFPHDAGSLVGHFDSIDQSDLLENFTPGQFTFVETRGFPLALGAFDDGLADGVRSNAVRKTREFRLEFAKRAFDSKWARGIFGAGYRKVTHDRTLAIDSFAIVPNLPPAIPPVAPDSDDLLRLAPLPDTVSQTSRFSGNGVGASLNLEFPLHRRFSVISGLGIGLIRGSASSEYVSTSSYYFLNGTPDVPLTKDQLFTILAAGDDIGNVDQSVVVVALRQPSTSQLAVTYDVYVGFEARVYRGLKVFLTLRDEYYSNVGEYVVPRPQLAIARTSLSAGYEGYVVGLSWRF